MADRKQPSNADDSTGRRGDQEAPGTPEPPPYSSYFMLEPPDEWGSLRLLRNFLRDLKMLMEDLLYSELIPKRHHQSLSLAWGEVEVRIGELLVLLTDSPHSVVYDLEKAGLMGQQLVAKLSVIYHARDEYLDHKARQPAGKGRWYRRWLRKLGWFVKPALKGANVVLGSMPAALFPGVEIIKEFKGSLETGIDVGMATWKATEP